MRPFVAMMAALAMTSCASSGGGDDRFQVGASEHAYVIIGIAKSADDTSPAYNMLWRRLDEQGAFTPFDNDNALEVETNSRHSERVRGIPGEFFLAEVDPGVYALDSVFGLIRDGRVNYVAQGIVAGPDRPAFEVRAGEAVYLGIWEVTLVDSSATARLWRMDSADLRGVLSEAEAPVHGEVRVRETQTRQAPCTPHPMSAMTTRRIC